MKKMLRGLWGVIAAILLLATIPIPADAAVQTFHAKGEYTMSDYETPEVAEQRAFAYAKQSAAEQAGVYVASYTKSINAQISEDRINMMAGTLLNVKNKTARKEAMPNGDVHIIVEMDADVNTSDIDKSLRDEKDNRLNTAAMYADLQKDIARQQKENEEMKQKIAALRAKGESVEKQVRESKAKEREFQSNQKVDEAWKLRVNKQYDAAFAAYNEAIQLNPKSAKAYNGRGLVYSDTKQYGKAIEDYNRAIAIAAGTDYTSPYVNRGLVYNDNGEYDRAIADYNRAIAIDPNDSSAYNNRGIAYDYKGQYDRAITDFNRAIEIDPNNSFAYNNRGYAYAYKGQYDHAIEDYNRAITIDPNNVEAYNNRGVAYDYKGQYDRAIEDYNRAIAIDPNNAAAYNNRGGIYADKEQYDLAIAYYSRALELDPRLVPAYFNRGAAYYITGQYRNAAEDFRRALKLDPSNQLFKEALQDAMRALSRR